MEGEIEMATKSLVGGVLVAIAFAVPNPTTLQAQSAPPKAKQNQTATKPNQSHDEGQRIFAQNCSRCHSAPEGFSPRIAGTVVRHMRVRAQLSEHDEKELLRFFNP
jgi:mono/diheme cytochrome c family protein